MTCKYCNSDTVTLNDGCYTCSSCGGGWRNLTPSMMKATAAFHAKVAKELDAYGKHNDAKVARRMSAKMGANAQK